MTRFNPFTLLLVGTMAVAAGCSRDDKRSSADDGMTTAPGEQRTLYQRLGGEDAIRQVVHDFVVRGANNDQVNFKREGHPTQWENSPKNVALLEKRLVQFIAMNTGGPQKYEGRDMVQAHTGMRITEVEFDALAKDLKASLDKFRVPEQEQNELLEIIGDTKQDIVAK